MKIISLKYSDAQVHKLNTLLYTSVHVRATQQNDGQTQTPGPPPPALIYKSKLSCKIFKYSNEFFKKGAHDDTLTVRNMVAYCIEECIET